MKKALVVLFAMLLSVAFFACGDDDNGNKTTVTLNSYIFTLDIAKLATVWEVIKEENGADWLTAAADLGTVEYTAYILAAPATALAASDDALVGDMWGTKVARMTKTGTGTNAKWSIQVSTASMDKGAWGSPAGFLAAKIVLVRDTDKAAFEATPGSGPFGAIPGGAPHVRFDESKINLAVPYFGFYNEAWDGGGSMSGDTNYSGVAANEIQPYLSVLGSLDVIDVPFELASTSPADGGVIAVDASLSVSFNQPLAAATVVGGKLAASVVMSISNDGSTNFVVNNGANVNAALSSDGKTLTLSGFTFIHLNDYVLKINSGIVSSAGAAFTTPIVVNFMAATPRTVTIWFVPDGVVAPAKVWMHSWGFGGFTAPGWPGLELTAVPGAGFTNFKAEFSTFSASGNIIFNDKGPGGGDSVQTADLVNVSLSTDVATYTVTTAANWVGTWTYVAP